MFLKKLFMFKWFKSRKCKHLNKKEMFRDYPDGYIQYKCLDCGEEIFVDMY